MISLMMKRKEYVILLFWLVLALALRPFKMHLGGVSFSFLAVSLPLIGYFLPFRHSFFGIILLFLATHVTHPIPLTMGIPTLLGALSWRLSKERKGGGVWLHCVYPLLAMVLFYLAPNGQQAWAYSLYWLIPVGLFFCSKGLVARTLTSSFIAHATGSLIWAYFAPLPGAVWLSLIPIVAMERLVMAGMTVVVILLFEKAFRPSFSPQPAHRL